MSDTVTVVPVEGRFLPGEPAVEKDVSPQEAERLVSSLAFIVKPAPTREAKPTTKDSR